MFRFIRNIAIVALVFAFTAQVSNAQATASTTVGAVVTTALTLAKETGTSINFGNLSATTSGAVVLDANAVTNTNVGVTNGVARFNVGGANALIKISYDATVALTCSTGTMTMTPEVVGSATSVLAAQNAATAITSGGTITPSSGLYYIWVGGSIPALTNQQTGTYAGTFNIRAEYN